MSKKDLGEKEYSWEEITVEALNMKEGDRRSFKLNPEAAQSGGKNDWTFKLNQARKDKLAISKNRSADTVTLQCYTPPEY